MPSISFANVGDQPDFTPIPAGQYKLVLVDWKEDTVKSGDNKGATMYKLTWEVAEDDGSKFAGRKIWDNQMFTEKSLPRVKGMLLAFGGEIDDSEGAEEVDFDYDELVGETLYAQVRIQPGNRDQATQKDYPAKNQIGKFLMPDEVDA